MNIIDEIRNDAAGLALLKDWIGSGYKTVWQYVAERRANVCASCSCNKEPNWWDRVKGLIASTIKSQLELKRQLNLKVSCEDDLNMCSICGCCAKLKVWTPIEHIMAHTTPHQLSKFPAHCWIKKEITQ